MLFQIRPFFMSRLIQLMRNSLIRLQGLFERVFGFVKQLFIWLFKPLQTLIKLLGLGESQYIEDEVQPSKPFLTEPKLPASTPQASPTTSSTRRRPDPNMDYFRKLATEVKTPKQK